MNEQDEEKKIEEVHKKVLEEKSQGLKKFLKIFSPIMVVSIWIILILVKIAYPDFALTWVILIGAFVLLFGFMLFFALSIKERFRKGKEPEEKEDKLPLAISNSEAKKIAKELLMQPDYADYLEEMKDDGDEEHGEKPKSKIYFIRCSGRYFKGEYFIAINCHYPKEKYRILIEPNTYQILQAKKLLASYPESTPDKKMTIAENQLTGTKIITTEETHKDKKEKKKKDKKEDLVE